MEAKTLKVLSVKVSRETTLIDSGRRYQSSPWARTSTEGHYLLIKGQTEDGKIIIFRSPQVEVYHTEGFLVGLSMASNKTNPWMKIHKEGQESYRGLEMFDGGNCPNVAIVDKDTLVPTFTAGQTIKIEHNTSKWGWFTHVKLREVY